MMRTCLQYVVTVHLSWDVYNNGNYLEQKLHFKMYF